MKVLMVCLGNICRSPLAEGILQKKSDTQNLGIKVESAGTSSNHVNEAPDPRSQDVALNHGIDISNLRGRQFVETDFEHFDVIFVMDSSNYQNVTKLAANEVQKKQSEAHFK